MRRDDKPKEDIRGKVKVRVIEFEMEGGSASLQESLRNIASAFSGSSQNHTRTIERPPASAALAAPGKEIDPDDIDDGSVIDVPAETSTASDNKTPRTRSRPRSPVPLELDFTKADVSLKDFCTTKAPKNDTQKYLVVAYWFKEYMGGMPGSFCTS
jgi:hypothetical protein